MGQVLIERWLAGSEGLGMVDEASVSAARTWVRDEAAKLSLPEPVTEALATSASELCHNQLRHAAQGRFVVRPVARAGVPGLELVAADQGAGIISPALSLTSQLPSHKGLGIGLGSVRRLSDEVDLDVRLREGSCVWARKFAAPVPRRREVAIYGRPIADEPESGDDAAFVRTDEGLLLAVVDGVGHGAAACVAAQGAIGVAIANAARGLDAIVEACGPGLAGTRGVAGAFLWVKEPGGTAEHAAVGNVETRFFSTGPSRGIAGKSGTLGLPGRSVRPRITSAPLDRTDMIAMFTDGLSRKTATDERTELIGQHPMIAASALFVTHARTTDDALILVAR